MVQQHLGNFFQRPDSIDSFWTKICSSMVFGFLCSVLIVVWRRREFWNLRGSVPVLFFFVLSLGTMIQSMGLLCHPVFIPWATRHAMLVTILGVGGSSVQSCFSLFPGDHYINTFVFSSFCCYLSCCYFHFNKVFFT